MGLKLIISPQGTTYDGVLDFDNAHSVRTYNTYSTDMANNKKITFKAWLDVSEGYAQDVMIHMIDNTGGNNIFDIGMDASVFRLKGYRGGYWNYYYPIGNYHNQVLDCEVNKTQTGISSFKINGVTQTATSQDSSSWGSFSIEWSFGHNNNKYLDNATLWDIKLYDTDAAGVLTHSWAGHPDGNTDAAWVDDVSSLNGVIQGSDPSMRDISSSGGGSGSGVTNILQIVPDASSVLLLAPPAESFPESASVEAYYSFEGASGTLADDSGNNNILFASSGVTREVTGKIDDCYSFSGTGYQQGNITTIATAIFSISSWIKTPNVSDRKVIIDMSKSDENAGYLFEVGTSGELRLGVSGSGSTDFISTTSQNWDDDSWHHVVVTHDGTSGTSGINFYADASLQGKTGSTSKTPQSNTGQFRIGNESWGLDYGFNGEIDEMGIWSTEISAANVSTLYNNGNGLAYP